MIWVMAGTGDSKKIINKMLKKNMKTLITVATDLGEKHFKNYSNVHKEILNENEMINFIKGKNINLIIDATHPFAKQASVNAISAAEKSSIKYMRYERKKTNINDDVYYDNYKGVVKEIKNKPGNILLTIGVKNLDCFSEIERERLFVKILPVKDSILKCNKHNISESNIIAVKGLVSCRLMRSFIKEFNIKHLVMKDSGVEGGTDIKIKACKREKINFYIIEREKIDYPNVYHDIKKLIKKIKKDMKE